MKSNKIPVKFKKIPYHLALMLLTLGASLILGFLSFSGAFAIIPLLSLAFAAFGLSVAYEGEIYLQNIKGALRKLFKKNYLQNHLAREFLLEHVPEPATTPECPQFFKDYKQQLEILALFGNKKLTTKSKKQKKQIQKRLKDMEQWFAAQLFATQNDEDEDSPYKKSKQQLKIWLAEHKQKDQQEQFKKRRIAFNLVKLFSFFTATFMGIGSTYLIVEAFSVIPLIAAIPFVFWPFMIIPMALIAGVAHGLLTYNAVTDLINNHTINKWYNKIRLDWKEGKIFIPAMAILLAGLAIALTICTAGTWWTVATHARPLFAWMSKMPSFIMGVINPIVTGLSAIFFNLQNTAESLELLSGEAASEHIFKNFLKVLVDGWAHLRATENWLQIINPFRIILKLTITPLRILLFLGHLVSIALTSDRMPGVPQIVAALISILCEGFEDAHYFINSNHQHEHTEKKELKSLLQAHLQEPNGHDHSVDIPTRILQTIATPLYALAALYDYASSRINQGNEENKGPKALNLTQAWNKQWSIAEEETVTLSQNVNPSKEWQAEHTIFLIKNYQEKHFSKKVLNSQLAQEKHKELEQIISSIRSSNASGTTLSNTLNTAKENSILNRHRLFSLDNEKTASQNFIAQLPQRVAVSA